MRFTLITATLAAGALALPRARNLQQREIVARQDDITKTEYDVVYVTDVSVVTVYDDAPTTTSAPTVVTTQSTEAAATSSPSYYRHHWFHSWRSSASSAAPATTEAPSSPAPAPSSYAAPSSSQAPAPVPSSYEAPSFSQAPAPSSYEAPSSTEAPASTWAPATSEAPSSTWVPAPSQASGTSVELPTGPIPTDYAGVAVWHHNIHRLNHSAPELAWDDGLAATAGKIAASCNYAHNVEMDGGGYGQNIAAGVEPANISAVITDLFYNGEVGWFDDEYEKAQPSDVNFEKWGHFTQIVWKDTTHVGCATQDCTAQGLTGVGDNVAQYFTVCNYKNPGNYANEYAKNVARPKEFETVDWNFMKANVQ